MANLREALIGVFLAREAQVRVGGAKFLSKQAKLVAEWATAAG
jgi:hypothetical protein